MISLHESKSSLTTILFDILLAIALPFILIISWPMPIPTSVSLTLIIIHIIIGITRYMWRKEIDWPVWADIMADILGGLFIFSAFYPKQVTYIFVIYLSVGCFIIYGHTRKIIWPHLPYYYGSYTKIEQTKTSNTIDSSIKF